MTHVRQHDLHECELESHGKPGVWESSMAGLKVLKRRAFLRGCVIFGSQQQDPNLLGRSDFLESMRMLCY